MIVVMTIGERYGLQIHIYMQIISDTVSWFFVCCEKINNRTMPKNSNI